MTKLHLQIVNTRLRCIEIRWIMRNRHFLIGAVCDIGKIREANEDSILIRVGSEKDNEFGLFVVADGLGGLRQGQIASQMVIEGLSKWWENELTHLLCDHNNTDISIIDKQLCEVINKINNRICIYAKHKHIQMASTLSMIFIFKNKYIVRHVGDSRIYIINQNVQQITQDHSWVNMQVKKGKMSMAEARVHPKRNILTSCLGITASIEIFGAEGELQKDDTILLCSDGFYNHVCEAEIEFVMYQHVKKDMDYAQYVAKQLFEKAMLQGGQDNISIILVKQEYRR